MRYRLVIHASRLGPDEIPELTERLASLLRISVESAAPLMAKPSTVLWDGLSLEVARGRQAALESIHIPCSIETPRVAAPEPQARVETPLPSSPAAKCPKCGHAVASGSAESECPRCGVVVGKYRAPRASEPTPAPAVTQGNVRETPERGPGAGLPRKAMLICGSVLLLVALAFWSSRNRGPEKSEGARRTEAVQEEARSLPYSIVGSWTGTHPDQLGSHVIDLTVGEDLTVVSTTIRRYAGKVTQTFSWAAPDTVAFNDDQIDATRIGERFVVTVDQPLGVGRYSLDAPALFQLQAAAAPLAARPALEVASDGQGLVANLHQVLVPAGAAICPPDSVLDFRPARFTIQDFCGMKAIYQQVPLGYVVEAPLIACEKVPLSQSARVLLTVRNPGIQIKVSKAGNDQDDPSGPQTLQSGAMVTLEGGEIGRTIELRFFRDGRKRALMPDGKIEWDLVRP